MQFLLSYTDDRHTLNPSLGLNGVTPRRHLCAAKPLDKAEIHYHLTHTFFSLSIWF